MRIIAIIPARGGSKGTPRKNVELVGGVPLIARSILSAMRSSSVFQVIVSTDDPEIARISNEYGALVILRPPEMSLDTSMWEEAVLHVLSVVDQPDAVVVLQCTSPFTSSRDIDQAVQVFIDQKADSLVSVVPTHAFLWKRGQDGFAVAVNHDQAVRPRRQDLEPQYLENGAIHVMDTPGFLKIKHRYFGKIAISEMEQNRWLEIDTPWDMFLAQMLVNHIE